MRTDISTSSDGENLFAGSGGDEFLIPCFSPICTCLRVLYATTSCHLHHHLLLQKKYRILWQQFTRVLVAVENLKTCIRVYARVHTQAPQAEVQMAFHLD